MSVLNFTYLITACIGARAFIEVGRLFLRWIMNKFSAGKVQSPYKRLVAIVSPELHAKIKAHVTLLDTTITEYILIAVTEKLKRETNG